MVGSHRELARERSAAAAWTRWPAMAMSRGLEPARARAVGRLMGRGWPPGGGSAARAVAARSVRSSSERSMSVSGRPALLGLGVAGATLPVVSTGPKDDLQ